MNSTSCSLPQHFSQNFNSHTPKSEERKKLEALDRNAIVQQIKNELEEQSHFISKHSLLTNNSLCPYNPGYQPLINILDKSTKGLTNIALAYSAKNTGFEGWSSTTAASYFSTIIKLIQDKQGLFCKSLPTSLQSAILKLNKGYQVGYYPQAEIRKMAFEVIQSIQQLKMNESYIMDGGWAAYPAGHTMYYRFERSESTTLNIYIYNAQNIEWGGLKTLDREKTHLYLCFRGVKASELFFTESNLLEDANPILFETIIKLKTEWQTDFNTNKVIGCFAHLQHRVVGDKGPMQLFISLQKSGNCTIKSLNALCLDLLSKDCKSKDETVALYKKLSLDIRFFTILTSSIIYSQNTYEDEITLFQLKEAATNFLRFLNKKFKVKKLEIGEEEFTIAVATISQLLDYYKTEEERFILQGRQNNVLNISFDQKSEERMIDRRKENITKTLILVPDSPKVFSCDDALSTNLGVNASWNDLFVLVTTHPKFQEDPKDVREVEVTLRNLSHLKYFPVDISPSQALSLLEKLIVFEEKYIRCVSWKSDYASPETKVTAFEFLALSYQLAIAADEKFGVLKNYGINVNYFFKIAKNDVYFTILDPKTLIQWKKLEEFFNHLPMTDQIFNFENYFHDEEKFLEGEKDDSKILLDYQTRSESVAQFLYEWGVQYEFSSKVVSQDLASDPIFKQKMMGVGRFRIFQSHSKENFPSELECFRVLKLAALNACCLCGMGDAYFNNDAELSICSNGLNIKYLGMYWNTVNPTKLNYDKTGQSDFPRNSYEKDEVHPQSTHNSQLILSENQFIVNHIQMNNLDSANSIYIALSEPGIQTSILLTNLGQNLECLKDNNYRSLFRQMITKLLFNESLISPFINELSDPSYLFRFEILVKEGKKLFIDSANNFNIHLEEYLFLVYLYGLALQTVSSIHANYHYLPTTREILGEQISYLSSCEKNRDQQIAENNDVDLVEILIAKLGLYTGIPLSQLSIKERVDLWVTYFQYKNIVKNFNKSFIDPSFLRLINRRFFELENQWTTIFQNSTQCDQFGNGVLEQILKTEGMTLTWQLESGKLVAHEMQANEKIVWSLFLNTGEVTHSNGYIEMCDFDIDEDEYERLFRSEKYEFINIGSEIRFYDPLWGDIKIKDKLIQRRIGQEWYTYISSESKVETFVINEALFYDHALWYNSNNNQDIKIFDLTSGKLVAYFVEGVIYKASSQKVRLHLVDESHPHCNQKVALDKLENGCYINYWIKENPEDHSYSNGELELARYSTSQGQTLSFVWNETSGWEYVENREFHIDTGIDWANFYHIQRYLPLVNQEENKRKLLIPRQQIESSGYSSFAMLVNEAKQDGNKKSLTYYEYDVINGDLIPNSLASRIYLTHLYLAQKKYQVAISYLKSISLSEILTSKAESEVASLLLSHRALRDESPNACAVRLRVFLIFKKINPFKIYMNTLADDELTQLLSIYQTYIQGFNHVEEPLILNLETELELLEVVEKLSLQTSNHGDFVERRRKFLNSSNDKQVNILSDDKVLRPYRYVQYTRIGLDKIPPFSKYDNKRETFVVNHIDVYFCDNFISFYRNKISAKTFRNFYTVLASLKGNWRAPEAQGIFYQLLLHKKNLEVNEAKLAILFMIAACKKAPPLPIEEAYLDEKISWYEQIQRLEDSYCKQTSSLFNFADHTAHNLLDITLQPSYFKQSTSSLNRPIHTLEVSERITSKPNANSVPLILAPPSKDHVLYNWQKTYCHEAGNENHLTAQPKSSTKITLRETELEYESAIQKRVSFYDLDCSIAQEQAQKQLVFKSSCSFEQLLVEIQANYEEAQKEEKELKDFIIEVVNRNSSKSNHFIQHHATVLGLVRPKLKLEVVLRAASQTNPIAAFTKLNLHLSNTDNVLDKLRKSCIEFMTVSTHRQHLERLKFPLEKWIATGRTNTTLFEKVQDAIRENRSYDPYTQPFPLLFEYLSGMRIRQKQTSIIELVLKSTLNPQDDQLKAQIFQLIMAGGKTSVINSILMEVISEYGFLACALCHSSQMASVVGNLRYFQSTRFSKDVYVLDYTLQQLSDLEILEFILKRLKEAERKGIAVVMKTTFPQILEHKLILEANRIIQIDNFSEGSKCASRLKTLNEQKKIFRNKGVNFYDECDINLSILTDVNVPQGGQKNVSPERFELFKNIYELLLDPAHRDRIGLTKNLQADLPHSYYEEAIVPFIADSLFSYAPLKWEGYPHLKGAFKRYLANQISAEDQQISDQGEGAVLDNLIEDRRENVEFLSLLKQFYQSEDRYFKQAANLNALVRRMVQSVLPVALSFSYNRRYGRNLKKDNGSIDPFLAVGTPATTRFGNIDLALALHFQSALNAKISKGEIKFLVDKMTEAANFYAKKENCAVLDTLEAKQFFTLTGVTLVEIRHPDKLEQAYQYVNDENFFGRRLTFEAEVAPFHIHYHTECLSSNSINSASGSNSRKQIACSATIWNAGTYNKALGKPLYDQGTEGSILNLLRSRIQRESIHEIRSLQLDSFFQMIAKHPKKDKIRSIIDAGGFLREEMNAELAMRLNIFLASEIPSIQGIVYLHKFSPEEVEDGMPEESFVVLKTSENKPRLLKNTSTEEIKKAGVETNTIFVFFDELRCTGTDFELADDAIFLMTVDSKMTMRTGLQGAFRARKIFKDQALELVVTNQGRHDIVDKGQTFDAIQKTWEKNEAVILKKQADRARIAEIGDVVRSTLLDQLSQLIDSADINIETFRLFVKNIRPFIFSQFQDNPYEQSGRIQSLAPTLTVLEAYADKLLGKFKNSFRLDLVQNVEEKLNNLLDGFQAELKDSPEKMTFNLNVDIEATVELVQEQEIQLDLTHEQEAELSVELQTEYQNYNYAASSEPYIEQPWILKNGQTTWKTLTNGDNPILSVNEVLQRPYKGKCLTKDYSDCFPLQLYMTPNFYRTTVEELPVFHTHSKRVEYILVLENTQGALRTVFISEKEASFFKRAIAEGIINDAFLINNQGVPELQAESFASQTELFKHEVSKGIWYANLYNGNISFLEQNLPLSNKLIKNKIFTGRFLSLRILNSPLHLRKFMNSHLFGSQNSISNESRVMFSSRRNQVEEAYKKMSSLTKEQVQQLDPGEIFQLKPNQVCWLTKPEQLMELTNDLIDHITIDQLDFLPSNRLADLSSKSLIAAIKDPERIGQLIPEQFIHLTPSQIVYVEDRKLGLLPLSVVHEITAIDQISRFKEHLVGHLSKTQINAINVDQVKYLSDQQVSGLNEPQLIHALPNSKVVFLDEKNRQFISSIEGLVALPNANGLTEDQHVSLRQHFAQLITTTTKPLTEVFKPWQIIYCPSEFIKNIEDSQTIRHLSTELVPYMTENQVGYLGEAEAHLLAHLPIHLIPFVKHDLVSFIREPLQKISRNETSRKIISQLTSIHTPYLTDEALNCIAPSLVKELREDELKRLKETHLLLEFPVPQLHLLTIGQREIVDKKLMEFETNESIIGEGRPWIKFFRSPQLSLVPPALFEELLSAQVAQLSQAQIQKATEEGVIEDLPNAFIDALSSEAVRGLAPNEAQRLNLKQVSQLDPSQMALIENLYTVDALAALSDLALQKVSIQQLKLMNQSTFSRVKEANLLMHAVNRIKDCSDEQKQIIREEVSKRPIEQLQIEYFTYLTKKQVKSIRDTKLIKELNATQIGWLTLDQIRLFKPDELTEYFITHLNNDVTILFNESEYIHLVHFFDKEQLNRLQPGLHTPIIHRLPSHRLGELSDKGLQEISTEQLEELDPSHLNRITKPSLLLEISISRLPLFPMKSKELYVKALNGVKDVKQVNVQREHIANLPVVLLSLLNQSDYIHWISSDQIAGMTLSHKEIVNRLSPDQIKEMKIFPKDLIQYISAGRLRHLSVNFSNLSNVPLSLQKHLNDEQLNLLYPLSLPLRLIGGIGLTLTLIPRLVLQFSLNILALAGMLLFSIVSASLSPSFKRQVKKTFYNDPCRAFAGLWLLFNKAEYRRKLLQIDG